MPKSFKPSGQCGSSWASTRKRTYALRMIGWSFWRAANSKDGRDVIGLQVGIVRQDLFTGRARSQEIEHFLDADPQASDAGSAPAHGQVDGDAIVRTHLSSAWWRCYKDVHSSARSGATLSNAGEDCPP